jgi:hypothetical protein
METTLVIVAVVLLLALIGYHARLEWVEGLAEYLCRLVRLVNCPRWLAPILSVLAVSILALPLVAAVVAPDYRPQLLALAAGGFLGDIFSTHIIPTWITGRRSPALSTWWAYLLVGGGLVVYLTLRLHFHPWMFILGIVLFVGLWPGMLGLRAATR